jgi:chromosome segregation ATPase
LIGALKDQNAALKATVSQLEQQYAGLAQPGGVAAQVGSLQQQLALVLGQLQQQQQMVHDLACRAQDAQQTAQAAAAQVELASRVLQEVQTAAAAAVQGDIDGGCGAFSSLLGQVLC